jgi:phosphotransferase system HPr (HPr) family protein
MSERRITLPGPLHVRPASLLSLAAGNFNATLRLEAGGRGADPRSVLSIMALDVQVGQEVVLQAEGPDAHEAVERLAEVLLEVRGHDG